MSIVARSADSQHLDDVLDQHRISLAGDVTRVAEHTWAIHGAIAVDGEVIIAEFQSAAEARAVLAQLPTSTGRDGLPVVPRLPD